MSATTPQPYTMERYGGSDGLPVALGGEDTERFKADVCKFFRRVGDLLDWMQQNSQITEMLQRVDANGDMMNRLGTKRNTPLEGQHVYGIILDLYHYDRAHNKIYKADGEERSVLGIFIEAFCEHANAMAQGKKSDYLSAAELGIDLATLTRPDIRRICNDTPGLENITLDGHTNANWAKAVMSAIDQSPRRDELHEAVRAKVDELLHQRKQAMAH